MASLLTFAPMSVPCSFPSKTTGETLSRRHHQIVETSKFGSYLDLEPRLKPESLDFEVPIFYPPDRRNRFDVIVIGTGPAGLRLAEQISGRGIEVCAIDPSPLSMWPNNYGVWSDEFESLGLEDCLDKTWAMTSVHIDDKKTKYLDRAYGRVNRKDLKLKLLSACAANGVKFFKGKALTLEHAEFESSVGCEDGTLVKASLVVDTSGFTSGFLHYEKQRNHGYQIAHGILAEVDSHPFDLVKMVLMDWRDSHLGNEPYLRTGNSRSPTFLYAMPFDSNLVFLEETSLVSRPMLSYTQVKKRMEARLRHLGIRVKVVLEDEKCVIPMGGPLPRIPQSVLAFGGNAGIVHPSTGYCIARTMALAPVLAQAIEQCLGSTRMIRGNQMYTRVWDGLWPLDGRLKREYYNFGMEVLLKLDLNGMRRFFDAFFDLKPHLWQAFLSQRLSLGEQFLLMNSLFWRASGSSKMDIATKSLVPLVKMARNMASQAI